MGKITKVEITGLVLMITGGLFWLSEKYLIIDQMKSFYSLARIVFFLGLAIWALGFAKKEAGNKKDKDDNS